MFTPDADLPGDFDMWRDGHLTLGEALCDAQSNGRSVASAEIVLCKQAADYFDEMAEQIITPVNSKARKILQDMALAIRQAATKYGIMDERFPKLIECQKLLKQASQEISDRRGPGHTEGCPCSPCLLVKEINLVLR